MRDMSSLDRKSPISVRITTFDAEEVTKVFFLCHALHRQHLRVDLDLTIAVLDVGEANFTFMPRLVIKRPAIVAVSLISCNSSFCFVSVFSFN